MPDNPRISGHPSDMPSSRTPDQTSGSGYSQNNYTPPPPPQGPQPGSSGNNQTRNILIGTIATIIASTSVYYLTQYINNRKTDSTPSSLVMKEATTNAWKRYVTMENIYYKAAIGITDYKSIVVDEETTFTVVDKFVTDLAREADIFKKDAAKIAKEKNVDPALTTMLNRRIDRQTEFIDLIRTFVAKAKGIYNKTRDTATRDKKINTATAALTYNMKLLYEKAATEIEELSKTLSATYAIPFDPNEVQIFSDYKKNISGPNSLDEETIDTASYLTNFDSRSLVGNWDDHGNKISLLKDNTFNYSLLNGEKAAGSWKIEGGKLRLDAVHPSTKQQLLWLFRIKDITANSFTMTLNISPFDTYHLERVKSK